MAPARITYGLTSDKGERRTNEDAALALVVNLGAAGDFGLFLVADGMGGSPVGEFASALAVQTVFEVVVEKLLLPLLSAQVEPDSNTIFDVLTTAFRQANQAIIQQTAPGGSTLTGVVIIGDTAYMAHVGDTAAYFVTASEVIKLTRVHDLIHLLIELGELTWDDIHSGRVIFKNVVYRVLGASEVVEVDSHTQSMLAQSDLLVCSDGIWARLSEAEIQQIVLSCNSPQQASETLIRAISNSGRATDNMTALVVQVGD